MVAFDRLLAAATLAATLVTGCGGPPVGPPSGTTAPPTPTVPTHSATPSPTTPPATPSSTPTADPTPPAPEFSASVATVTLDDLGASWHAGRPVGPGELRALAVTHWGYDGEAHTGRLIVAEEVAADVAAIMGDLFTLRFPIESMVPVDAFGGDDDASMAANNTSAFNCRTVTGGAGWSDHAFGRAIDLNPVANPYVLGSVVLPPAGVDHVDRSQDQPGMIHADDAVVRAFAARGWSWGGVWTRPIDYQHFYRSREE